LRDALEILLGPDSHLFTAQHLATTFLFAQPSSQWDDTLWSMMLTWVVLFSHIASFVLPLLGVLALYRRAHGDLAAARTLTAAAREVLAWHEEESQKVQKHTGTWTEKKPQREDLERRYSDRVENAGLNQMTWGDAGVAALTSGRSNIVQFANAVKIARSDAALVIVGLLLGLVANLIPTIWTVPALIGT
jgi:hypothetical protein